MRSLLLMCLIFGCFGSDIDVIRPILGVPFGKIAIIKIEIVEKGNDYYEQYIIKENFKIKIIKINGIDVTGEKYAYPGTDSNDIYEIGKQYDVRAYETVNSVDEPRNWDENEPVKQMDYRIEHKIVISKNGLTNR